MFINALLNGIIQVVIFSLIPLVFWLLTARKKENFFSWIGFKKVQVNNNKDFIIKFLLVLVIGFAVGELILLLMDDVNATTSQYTGLGISAVPSAIAYALIQTSLSEEILFRGFILKRLSNRIGFWPANFIQGAIFGLLHLVLLFGTVSPFILILNALYPMVFAMAFGWLNEKNANGSIYPSWCIHAIVNIISQLLAIF